MHITNVIQFKQKKIECIKKDSTKENKKTISYGKWNKI